MRYSIFLPDDTKIELEAEATPKEGDMVRLIVGSRVETYIVAEACWEIKEEYAGKLKGVDTYRHKLSFFISLKDPKEQ